MKYINARERAALKIKAKHLATEARIIRQEEIKWRGNDKLYFKEHRKTTVRQEARATQLAIAFMRGVPYRVMERKCINEYLRDTTITKRMVSMILKYSNSDFVIPHQEVGECKDWRERGDKLLQAKKQWVQSQVRAWFREA